MAVTFPSTLIFGKGNDLPPIPEGWEFNEDAEDFLTIFHEDRGSFLVQKEDGWTVIYPVRKNCHQKKNVSSWIVTDKTGIRLCKWPEKEKPHAMEAPSLQGELKKYLDLRFPDERCPVGEEEVQEARTAFAAGAFMALAVWNDLACQLPKHLAEPMLVDFIRQTEAACDPEIKAGLRSRN